MTAAPDTRPTRSIPDADRSARPRRAVVGVSVGVGVYGILDASPLDGPSGHDGGLDRCVGGPWGLLAAAGRSRHRG